MKLDPWKINPENCLTLELKWFPKLGWKVHAYNSGSQEAEAEASCICGQPVLYCRTLSLKTNKNTNMLLLVEMTPQTEMWQVCHHEGPLSGPEPWSWSKQTRRLPKLCSLQAPGWFPLQNKGRSLLHDCSWSVSKRISVRSQEVQCPEMTVLAQLKLNYRRILLVR